MYALGNERISGTYKELRLLLLRLLASSTLAGQSLAFMQSTF